jgi:hypothetical protein
MTSKVRDANSSEVFGEWLKHEYSSRLDFHDYIDSKFPGSSDLINLPDYLDPMANQRRLQILKSLRRGVIEAIPADTTWTISLIDQQSLLELTMIDSSPWHQMSSNSLRALDAAKAIDSNPVLCRERFGIPVNYILDDLESLAIQRSKIIAIASEGGPIVVIDGVHRTVALVLFYLIRRIEEFSPREIYLGWSSSGFRATFG